MDAILNILTQLWEFLSRVIISAFPILNALFIIGAGCLGMLLYGKFKPCFYSGLIPLHCFVLPTFGCLSERSAPPQWR